MRETTATRLNEGATFFLKLFLHPGRAAMALFVPLAFTRRDHQLNASRASATRRSPPSSSLSFREDQHAFWGRCVKLSYFSLLLAHRSSAKTKYPPLSLTLAHLRRERDTPAKTSPKPSFPLPTATRNTFPKRRMGLKRRRLVCFSVIKSTSGGPVWK